MARRYDSSTTTFSPEGRLHQVEYAIEAINNAGTSVGILAKDGVVMASERKITSGLLAPARVRCINSVEDVMFQYCAACGYFISLSLLFAHLIFVITFFNCVPIHNNASLKNYQQITSPSNNNTHRHQKRPTNYAATQPAQSPD